MDHPRSGYRYLDAKDLNDSATKFDGIEVQGSDGEKLGDVEGFVVDTAEGRPRHVAVAAGWFFHKHFLIPIGHVGLNEDGTKLRADLTKERVNRFPGFDKDRFQQLTTEELEQLDRTLATAAATDEGRAGDFDRHYDTPGWWKASFYVVESRSGR
jgi:hypothetical protein